MFKGIVTAKILTFMEEIAGEGSQATSLFLGKTQELSGNIAVAKNIIGLATWDRVVLWTVKMAC